MSVSKSMRRMKRVVALAVAFALALNVTSFSGEVETSAATIGSITNVNVIYDNSGPLVDLYPASGNNKAVRFSFDGEYEVGDSGSGLFSVKVDGGSEYYYGGETITSSTVTPGVYYSDGTSGSLDKGWYFVYPDGDTSKNISVQVLMSNASYVRNMSISYSGFNNSSGTWITDGSLKSEIDKKILDNSEFMNIRYIDYAGTVIGAVHPSTGGGLTTFNSKALRYYIDNVSASRAEIKIYYGNKLVKGTDATTYVYFGETLSNNPGYADNSNCFKLNSNMESADYISIQYWSGFSDDEGKTKVSYANTSSGVTNKIDGKGSAPTNLTNIVKIPPEGLFFPLSLGSDNKTTTLKYGSFCEGQDPVIKNSSIEFKGRGGPTNITFNSINVGQSVSVYDADTFATSLSKNAAKTERVLGTISTVNGSAIGSGYSDKYIDISPSGMITAKKGSKGQTYTLVTKTPYTKFRNVSGLIVNNKEPILYDTGAGTSNDTYKLGYQTWTVKLTISAIKGEGEDETTEKATTTEIATTTQGGTTTEAVTTSVGGTTENATTSIDATTSTKATTETPAVISSSTEIHTDDLDDLIISKITSKKLKLTVKWNEVSGADGYEVYIANSKAFTNYERALVISNKTSCVIDSFNCKKLKKGKKYYIVVRPFKGVPEYTKIEDGYSKVCKKKGKMNIIIPSDPDTPNLRKTKIQISSSETSGFKTVATVRNTLRKQCTVTVKKYKSKKLKKGKTYYIKLIKVIDQTPKEYGNQSAVKGCKCKK